MGILCAVIVFTAQGSWCTEECSEKQKMVRGLEDIMLCDIKLKETSLFNLTFAYSGHLLVPCRNQEGIVSLPINALLAFAEIFHLPLKHQTLVKAKTKGFVWDALRLLPVLANLVGSWHRWSCSSAQGEISGQMWGQEGIYPQVILGKDVWEGRGALPSLRCSPLPQILWTC